MAEEQPQQRNLDRVPARVFWAKVYVFLTCGDAAAVYATSAGIRAHTEGKWSPRWTAVHERAARMAVATRGGGWEQLGWNGDNPAGIKMFAVRGTPSSKSALVQQIQLGRKDLCGARVSQRTTPFGISLR